MDFDLTKEIPLDKNNYKKYRIAQSLIYFLAFLTGLYLAYLIIFPTQPFLFMFHSPNASRNSIINPRNDRGEAVEQGELISNENLLWDAVTVGSYSKADMYLLLDKRTQNIGNNSLRVRKSYQAFFYPEGESLGFKDGTLVKVKNNYYIISKGKIRKFSNFNITHELGFNPQAFLEVQEEDLKYNEAGEDINNSSTYPDSSIFKINEEYYILENKSLKKFISPNAYFTHYDFNQALEKTEEFLANYSMDENLIGFNDGTLISYGISAYIVSLGKIHPINNVTTFTSMGYDWNDVIAASGDEISLYEKEKLFTIDSPHPDGTIMVTKEDSKWYRIDQKRKRPLASENIARSWFKKSPIITSSESLSIIESCQLKFVEEYDDIISQDDDYDVYSCTIPIETFKDLIGKTYEFDFKTTEGIDIEEIRIDFEMAINWKNFKSGAGNIINRIKGTYVPQTAVTIQ